MHIHWNQQTASEGRKYQDGTNRQIIQVFDVDGTKNGEVT